MDPIDISVVMISRIQERNRSLGMLKNLQFEWGNFHFNFIWTGEGQNGPPKGFAKYLINDLADLYVTL